MALKRLFATLGRALSPFPNSATYSPPSPPPPPSSSNGSFYASQFFPGLF